MLKSAFSWLASKCKVLACLAAVLALTVGSSVVRADPPTMSAITLPVDGASIVTAVITIGITVLLLTAGAVIGFGLVRKLIRRISKAV
jgi:hypothetical protein